MEDFSNWLNKKRESTEYIDSWKVRAMSGLFNIKEAERPTILPPLWHWLFFLETVPQNRIGGDGHPQKGDFLPPVPHPRRMFAGARTEFFCPLQLNKHASLVETVTDIQTKKGGALYIVTVRYEYFQENELCIREERDFVYLPAPTVIAVAETPSDELHHIESGHYQLDYDTDPTVLFRFSALTYNSHRIHYDADYAKQQEGYPQLVVHGPLTAMLSAECLRRHSSARIKKFSFRAQSPVYCGQKVRLRAKPETSSVPTESGKTLTVLAYKPDSSVAMTSNVELY